MEYDNLVYFLVTDSISILMRPLPDSLNYFLFCHGSFGILTTLTVDHAFSCF